MPGNTIHALSCVFRSIVMIAGKGRHIAYASTCGCIKYDNAERVLRCLFPLASAIACFWHCWYTVFMKTEPVEAVYRPSDFFKWLNRLDHDLAEMRTSAAEAGER